MIKAECLNQLENLTATNVGIEGGFCRIQKKENKMNQSEKSIIECRVNATKQQVENFVTLINSL